MHLWPFHDVLSFHDKGNSYRRAIKEFCPMKHEERKEIGSLNGVATLRIKREEKGRKKKRDDRATSREGRKEGRKNRSNRRRDTS